MEDDQKQAMEKKYSAPAVARLLDMIELMAKENRGFSINEMAKSLESPVNMVYRICKEMEERGYLEKDCNNGLYHLGARFFLLGQVAGSRIDLRTKALPVLSRLRDQTGETVHLTILQEKHMVLLEQVETKEPIRIYVETGALLYPHASAFGKCMLAFRPEEYFKHDTDAKIPALTKATITDADSLKKELENIKLRGYACDMEEYLAGVRCVGAPVHGNKGMGIAALGVVGPLYRFNDEKMKEAIMLVKEAAGTLSELMGFAGN